MGNNHHETRISNHASGIPDPASRISEPASRITPSTSHAPLVSICLPTLNARQFLEQRMASIFAQTLTNWELIVCDSYSDDGTWEYVQAFKDDLRVRLYQVPKEGLYAGWNECLRRCRGEHVYIATADDTMAPECLERMVGALEAARSEDGSRRSEVGGRRTEDRGTLNVGRETLRVTNKESPQPATCNLQPATVFNEARSTKHEEPDSPGLQSSVFSLQSDRPRPIDIAVCGFEVIDGDGVVVAEHKAGRWPRKFYGEWMDLSHIRDGRTEFLLHAALGIVWWTVTSVLFRRSLLDRIGLFRTDRGSQADQEWEMRAALQSDIVYLPEKLATWRVSEHQATAKLPGMSRTNLDCLETVLRDTASGIPQEWKAISGWMDTITHICRTEYQASFGLYGNVGKSDLKRFCRGFLKALRNEPGYLARQCLNRFRWHDQMSPDPIAYAHELIELFGAKWPPRRIRGS